MRLSGQGLDGSRLTITQRKDKTVYKSKFVRNTRIVNGIEVKCKPLSKSAVKRISKNLELLLNDEPSEMRTQAINNNKRKLAEMGIPPFDNTRVRLAWCDAYLDDSLEQWEKAWSHSSRIDLMQLLR